MHLRPSRPSSGTLGVFVHVFAAALGLSAPLATAENAFAVVKSAGATYLVYVGFALLRSGGGRGQEAGRTMVQQASLP